MTWISEQSTSQAMAGYLYFVSSLNSGLGSSVM